MKYDPLTKIVEEVPNIDIDSDFSSAIVKEETKIEEDFDPLDISNMEVSTYETQVCEVAVNSPRTRKVPTYRNVPTAHISILTPNIDNFSIFFPNCFQIKNKMKGKAKVKKCIYFFPPPVVFNFPF